MIKLIGDYTEDKSARNIHSTEFEEQFADYLLANNIIVLPCEYVYFIVDKGTKYAMAMPKRTDELPLYKLRDLEKYGYYLSKEEAEKASKDGVKE